MTDEPARHAASARNRRKMQHQAEVVRDELQFLLVQSAAREVNIRYALSKTLKMLNRMKLEFDDV